ncbi:MAG: hemerythrin domain-containing protein [Pseudonocardiaceae bacterium]
MESQSTKSGGTTDITQLILDDHETFRRQFAALDDAEEPEQLRAIWEPLAALLDVHAVAEEDIFYPQLLRRGDDAEDETIDAIGDHNDIRDAVHEAARHPLGSSSWWEAVRQARVANSSHMAEEEDDALPDFRRNSSLDVREELGRRFLEFKTDHAGARDLDTSDKDPEEYVSAVQAQIDPGNGKSSLSIGSLKER